MNIISFLYKALLVIIISYLVFGIMLFLSQKSMIYFPDNQDMTSCLGFEDYNYKTQNETRFLFKENSGESIVVIYHGNIGSVCDRTYIKNIVEKTNHSILFVEYTGFSNDSKKPSKDAILQNVKDTNHFLTKNVFKEIIVIGESLGSGAASYHANMFDITSLLLLTPFSSIIDIGKSQYFMYPLAILVTENFDNVKWLSNYSGRVHIFHGSTDAIIPHKLSQKLFESIPSDNKYFYLYDNLGHNNLWSSDKFKEELLKNIS